MDRIHQAVLSYAAQIGEAWDSIGVAARSSKHLIASSSSIGYPRDVAETITRAGFDSGIVSYQSDQLLKTSALFFHLIFWRNCVLSSLVLVTMAPS